jgi:hypothetical protein
MEPQFTSLSARRRSTLADGVTAQALFGERVILNLVELAPDALVPEERAALRPRPPARFDYGFSMVHISAPDIGALFGAP